MREFIVLVWFVLLIITSVLLVFFVKRHKRKLDKYAVIYKLVLMLTVFLCSSLTYFFLYDSPHIIWVTRTVILILGMLNVYALYKRPWTIRHPLKYEEDSFLVESLFVSISALLAATIFTKAPQIWGILPYSKDVSATIADAPLWFWLPFLVYKLRDFSGQVPFKLVENPWVFPLEPVNADQWPWRNLMQVNFEIRRSLIDEYDLAATPARPWIEAPKEVSIGMIFRLAMQERRKKESLTSIQDMGDEYDGTPRFCWIFSIKKVWYNPLTWFRESHFINPDLSVVQNKLQKGDIILVRRIPGDGTKTAGLNYSEDFGFDADKTVIIKR